MLEACQKLDAQAFPRARSLCENASSIARKDGSAPERVVESEA